MCCKFCVTIDKVAKHPNIVFPCFQMPSVSKDPCSGNQRDPLIATRCDEIIRKIPEQPCGAPFTYRISQLPVCQKYCQQHRFCYLEMPDGSRCPNLRRSLTTHYCKFHVKEERACGKLVGIYKQVCGDDPKSLKCVRTDDEDTLEAKEDFFNDCYQKRKEHHEQCLHRSAWSLGHAHFLTQMNKMGNDCGKMLVRRLHWHDAPLYNEEPLSASYDTDYSTDNDDLDDGDDIFSDASEDFSN